MRKKIAILLAGAAAVTLFSGCGGGLNVEQSTIELKKNGTIYEASVEKFDQSYYQEDELKSYVDNSVSEFLDEYASDYGKRSVSVQESKVSDGKAYLTLKYKNAEVFGKFSGIECFSGSVIQAQAEGYDFDQMDFYPVTDGKMEKKKASTSDLLKDDDLKTMIVRENSDLIVPGDICYVSAEGTEVTSKNTVSVQQKEKDTDEAVLVCVLYK